jgi:hypothetical protein
MKLKIHDRIEIKPGMHGIKHAPGLVIVVDIAGHGASAPQVGDVVQIQREGKADLKLIVGETKKHGPGRSFYFEGVTRLDVPADSIFSWEPPKHRRKRRRRPVSSGKS